VVDHLEELVVVMSEELFVVGAKIMVNVVVERGRG
jgi:hypothetical protein